MKTFTLPPAWDARKFTVRYGLTINDFYVGGDGLLNTPDSVPDNPIFDPPDTPAEALAALHTLVAAMIDDAAQPQNKLMRAALAVIFDEMNLHALKINQILDAMDAATTLADLKTRVAAINDYPARTMAQAVTAVKNKITTGGAD
jgi:hypothetical protein